MGGKNESQIKTQITNELSTEIRNKTTNINRVKNEQELNSTMNQSSVIQGMNKMVLTAINKAVAKNQGDLLRSLAVSNTIAIGSAKGGGDFNISNVNQENVVQQEVIGNFVQSISAKIVSDMTTSITDQVDSVKNATKDTNISNSTTNDKKRSACRPFFIEFNTIASC
jgi:hypothetical protein